MARPDEARAEIVNGHVLLAGEDLFRAVGQEPRAVLPEGARMPEEGEVQQPDAAGSSARAGCVLESSHGRRGELGTSVLVLIEVAAPQDDGEVGAHFSLHPRVDGAVLARRIAVDGSPVVFSHDRIAVGFEQLALDGTADRTPPICRAKAEQTAAE